MLSKTLSLCVAGLLAVGASAQCATLTVSGTGAPGTTLSFTLDGSTANAFAFLTIGDTQGTTTINLGPLGSLTLGLALPFAVAPIGLTNASGDASLAINVPNVPGLGADLFAQGVTLAIVPPTPPFGGGGPPSLGVTWCTSNVAGFHIGN